MLRGLENAGAMSNIFPLSVVPNFSSFHMAICLIAELGEGVLSEMWLYTPCLGSFGGEVPTRVYNTLPFFSVPRRQKTNKPKAQTPGTPRHANASSRP